MFSFNDKVQGTKQRVQNAIFRKSVYRNRFAYTKTIERYTRNGQQR